MNHLEPPRSHRRAQRLTRSQPQQIARRQRPDHAARLVDHSEVAHLAFGRSPDRRTRPQGPPPTACSSGARPACAASRLHSGRPPQDVTLGGDFRSRSAVLSAQQPGQRRCIHALGEFVMDVAQRHPQVIAHSREIAPAQLLVERRSAPGGASAPSTNSPTSASPSGKTRQRDCCLKFLFGEQHFGIVTGARTRIFIDAFLHQEGCLLVNEIREGVRIANRPATTKKSKEAQKSCDALSYPLLLAVFSRR